MPFLNVVGVSKSFPQGKKSLEVLRDINLEIDKGEFVAIVGYSGSGKTTLISLLASPASKLPGRAGRSISRRPSGQVVLRPAEGADAIGGDLGRLQHHVDHESAHAPAHAGRASARRNGSVSPAR